MSPNTEVTGSCFLCSTISSNTNRQHERVHNLPVSYLWYYEYLGARKCFNFFSFYSCTWVVAQSMLPICYSKVRQNTQQVLKPNNSPCIIVKWPKGYHTGGYLKSVEIYIFVFLLSLTELRAMVTLVLWTRVIALTCHCLTQGEQYGW